MTKVELVKGTVFELDPSKKYLLVFDATKITKNAAEDLLTSLGKGGFKGLGFMYDGDPSSIKVIEQ